MENSNANEFETSNMTEQQRKLIQWTRQTLKRKEVFVGKPFIQRFLRARNFDTEKTKTMLKEYFEFRDEMLTHMPRFHKKKGRFNQITSLNVSKKVLKDTTIRPKMGNPDSDFFNL
jgi:hypothetical protein